MIAQTDIYTLNLSWEVVSQILFSDRRSVSFA
ncbi:hypothetical protein AVDCRST_MAG94-1967, partial [uncultured Leptolyngbya sp.]